MTYRGVSLPILGLTCSVVPARKSAASATDVYTQTTGGSVKGEMEG